MHFILEALSSAVASFSTHRLRSFLTILGILIGTASVIAVVSLVQGFSKSIESRFEDLGGSSLTLRAENSNENFRTGKLNKITFGDVDIVRYRIPGVLSTSPVMVVPAIGASYKSHNSSPQVFASTAEYQFVHNGNVDQGRFLVETDNKFHRRVAVIGPKLRDDLKMPLDAVGEYFLIGNEWFKVVGVMQKKGELLGFSQDNYIVIPFEVGRILMGSETDPIITVTFAVERLDLIEEIKDRVRRAIRIAHRIGKDKDDDFTVEGADSFVKQFEQVTSTATAVVAGVVGVSLLVGGIGIMNIMLVSVTERTREIGILKALGATRSDILLQFLFEAGLLSLVGGLMGIILGYAIGYAVTQLIPGFPSASVPFWVMVVAAGFSCAIGLIFGIAPAAKAASLNPIDALRYE
ncbi:ABC transporter permease [Rudaea sp.]|uniref:ABC transporter permease n=1 Tax=Rudaea sp. TaxID=2136325 RepID=UPI003784467B